MAMVEHVIKCLNAVRLFILMVRVRIIINMISFVLIHMIITNTKLTRARVIQLTIGLGGLMPVKEELGFINCHIMAIDISLDRPLSPLAKNLGEFSI